MEHYLAIRENELSTHEKTVMNSKCMLLSRKSQFEEAACYTIPIIRHSGKSKST